MRPGQGRGRPRDSFRRPLRARYRCHMHMRTVPTDARKAQGRVERHSSATSARTLTPGSEQANCPRPLCLDFRNGSVQGSPRVMVALPSDMRHRVGCKRQANAGPSARICRRSLPAVQSSRRMRRRHQQAMARRKQTADVRPQNKDCKRDHNLYRIAVPQTVGGTASAHELWGR